MLAPGLHEGKEKAEKAKEGGGDQQGEQGQEEKEDHAQEPEQDQEHEQQENKNERLVDQGNQDQPERQGADVQTVAFDEEREQADEGAGGAGGAGITQKAAEETGGTEAEAETEGEVLVDAAEIVEAAVAGCAAFTLSLIHI